MRDSSDSYISWLFDSSYFTREEHILIMLLYVVATFINFGANSLVWIAVIKNSSLKSTMNYLLMSLSLADVIAGISVYPYVFILDVKTISHAPKQQSRLCILTEGMSFFFVASGVSLFILCAISCNRFLSICFLIRKNLRMSCISVTVFSVATWIISTACVLPGMLSLKYEPEFKSCIWNWGQIDGFVYRISILILGTLLPTTFLVVNFMAFVVKSRKIIPISDERKDNRRALKMRKAERMLGILIAVYLVCWLPFCLYWGIQSATNYFPLTAQGIMRTKRWQRVTILFATMNATLDPFVYTLGSSECKKAVKRLLKHFWERITCRKDARVNCATKLTKTIRHPQDKMVESSLDRRKPMRLKVSGMDDPDEGGQT